MWNWRLFFTKNSNSTAQDVEKSSEKFYAIQLDIPLLNALQTPACIVNDQLILSAANALMRAQFPQLNVNELITLNIRNPLFLNALNETNTHRVTHTITFTKTQEFDRIFNCQISPIHDAHNTQHSILIIFQDITSSTKIEQMRVDFVANASHELKTPIAAILGFIETLQGAAKNDPKAGERFLAIMHTQAKRMARLVDDLLSLSKMELLEHVPVQNAVNVGDVINEVVDSLNALAENSKISLRVHNTLKNANVLGDKDALFRMAENIISNAMKYGEGGEFVDITLENDAFEHLTIKIQDYGIGISADHLPRLTERFYRVDEARSREKGGTGLGLAIVKHCINRHKGTLKFESELGKGMKVEIVLPLS